jgi:hypothetical protein
MPDDDEMDESPVERIVEELREMPVGTRDPNIVGDVGPLDIPPGSDPHEPGEVILSEGKGPDGNDTGGDTTGDDTEALP